MRSDIQYFLALIKMEEERLLLNSLNAAIEGNDGEIFNSILRTFENQGHTLSKLDQVSQ